MVVQILLQLKLRQLTVILQFNFDVLPICLDPSSTNLATTSTSIPISEQILQVLIMSLMILI